MVSITMTIISISWFSFSRPFAIVSMVTIAISNMVSITMTIISIARFSSGSWLSFSISRPLAIISMVSIAIAMPVPMTISMAIVSITISVTISMSIAMAIIAIARLGNSHSKEGKRNSNQELHVTRSSFSTTLPM